MKKYLLILFSIFSLTACSLSNNPSSKVENYMNRYNNLSVEVKEDMKATIETENLSKDNQELYSKVLTRQYENLKYEIKDEVVDGDKANVTLKITVYDLHKSETASMKYLNEHNSEFYTNNVFNEEAYTKYRLNEMLAYNDTVDYELTFYLNKKDGEWVLENPDRITLEKIHGLYNYDES